MNIREIKSEEIVKAVEEMVIRANIFLPEDVGTLLEGALGNEESEIGCEVLKDIVNNRVIAAAEGLPICQDTGMAVFFCEVGQDIHISGDFESAVNEGVRRGYVNGKLRLSVVKDPVRRGNTGDNTPAVIYTRLVPGDRLKITFTPKGFGSENMSAVKMFNPTASTEDIENFIASVAINGGANPCPPVILGVGLGGTLDSAAVAAKYALCRSALKPNDDEFYAGMEQRILQSINRSGIGPMGLGGRTTALKVNITPLPTHIAGLPCVVNVCCHVARHAETEL
jgi:fumarate hydratase subunit alpha